MEYGESSPQIYFSIDTALCSAALDKANQLASMSGNSQYADDDVQLLSSLDQGENMFIAKVDETWYQPNASQTTLAGNLSIIFAIPNPYNWSK